MKKMIALLLTLTLTAGLLAGCAGAQVHVCPSEEAAAPSETAAAPSETAAAPAEGAVRTGLAVMAKVEDSVSASAEQPGAAKYDVTMTAVTVDDNGVIVSCVIDSVKSEITFGTDGVITTDLTAKPATKNELGEDYGMKAFAGSAYEWNEQVQALADYAVGKTVEELKNGAIKEDGKAKDADLASVATIYLGDYVSAIEKAVANAQHLGAQSGDKLVLTTLNKLDSSANADAENAGNAQLDVNIAVVTMNGDVITSTILDALQAKVAFDAAGQITSDVTAAPQTKNELGEAYGMKAFAGSAYEWNEQAAAFAQYVTGKTAAEVAGIAVTEDNKVTDVDLASTVTISVDGFQSLIAKAAQ